MTHEIVILLTEDDDGHAFLIERNLKRCGLMNRIIRFCTGDDVLRFLLQSPSSDGAPVREPGTSYLLLLDIRLPGTDGVEVLRQIKAHPDLRRMPVIMVTTTDDPREVERCHDLGCNNYITKPVDADAFMNAIRQLGLFLMMVQVPSMNGSDPS